MKFRNVRKQTPSPHRPREERQRVQYLFREFPNKIQRNTVELRVLQQLVQIIGKHLEDQTLMPAIHEMVQEPYDVLFVVSVRTS